NPSIAERTAVETYLVEDGDTLGGIAEKYGLSLSTLLWANNLTFRSTIKPGQELTILPKDGVTHKVANGDTLTKIATRYGVEADDIIDANRLASADDLTVGETLMVPGGEPPAAAAPARTASVTAIFTPPPVSGPAESRGSSTGTGS